jgi:hypothetical protein
LRRILVIATTALVVLAAAASASAALNTYGAKFSFTTKQAGTPAKPVPIGFTQDLSATAGTPGNRASVLLDIKTTVYGLKADQKDFPTCSLSKIAAAKTDTGCPKGALAASGFITAAVGSASDFTAAGSACDPLLHAWNSGPGKLTFFFVDAPPAHLCLGGALKTGAVGPYPATVKQQGKNIVIDTPVPSYVSFPLPGLAGSLETEHLKWLKSTRKVNGKTVALISSVGCSGSKRPGAVAFTATLPTAGPAKETQSVSSKSPC